MCVHLQCLFIISWQMSGNAHKRLRKKSRKLSEAEHDELTNPLVTRKKRSRLSVTSTTEEEITEGKLIVSLQNSVIGTRFLSRLKRKSTSHSSATSSSSSNNNKEAESESPAPVGQTLPDIISPRKTQVELGFKNAFSYSFIDKNKKRTWKSLRQIIQSDVNSRLDHHQFLPTYNSIEAPPPIKPPKKYSDVSGLLSNYTDPLTGLQFSSSEEFEFVRTLPTNVVQGYLSLRGKATIT